MKKKQPRLRRSLDADHDIRFDREEIRRLLKEQKEEGMGVSATIDATKAQAPPNRQLPYEVKSVKPRIG